MKTVLTIALLVLTTVVAPAIAQTGGIVGVYSDDGSYADCNLVAAANVPLSVYVVHQLTDANGSQFRLTDDGTGLTRTGYTSNHALTVGDPFVETTVTYDGSGCPHATPVLIGTISYVNTGTVVDCSTIRVLKAPSVDRIIALGCDGVLRDAEGGELYINGDETCPCFSDPTPYPPYPPPLPTAESTWGAIKSLYTE